MYSLCVSGFSKVQRYEVKSELTELMTNTPGSSRSSSKDLRAPL